MSWIPTSLALPNPDERVLIPTPLRVEIAARVSMNGSGAIEGPAYVWEVEGTATHYEPRAITHWMQLPSRP